MLRLLAEKVCVGIRKYEDSVLAGDDTGFTSCVTRQAGMANRICVPGANVVSDLKPGYSIRFPPVTRAAESDCRHNGRGERRRLLVRSGRGLPVSISCSVTRPC